MNKPFHNQAWHQVHVAREARSTLDAERTQVDARVQAARVRRSNSTFPATRVHNESTEDDDAGANDEPDAGH